MEVSQPLTPTTKLSRHGKHKNPNYQREYYRQNREKLLAYSHDYYGVKKLLKSRLKPKDRAIKFGVKKIFLTVTRNITSSNRYKELFFVRKKKEDYNKLLEERTFKGNSRTKTIKELFDKYSQIRTDLVINKVSWGLALILKTTSEKITKSISQIQ